jgi:hypothetical protein
MDSGTELRVSVALIITAIVVAAGVIAVLRCTGRCHFDIPNPQGHGRGRGGAYQYAAVPTGAQHATGFAAGATAASPSGGSHNSGGGDDGPLLAPVADMFARHNAEAVAAAASAMDDDNLIDDGDGGGGGDADVESQLTANTAALAGALRSAEIALAERPPARAPGTGD